MSSRGGRAAAAGDKAAPADTLDVQATDDVVTLTGTADTLAAKDRAATENAIEGGAARVVNDLTVRNGPDYFRSK